MKRCLQIVYVDGCEPNEVYPVDDEESAKDCFNILNQLDWHNVKVNLIVLSDSEWELAMRNGDELA